MRRRTRFGFLNTSRVSDQEEELEGDRMKQVEAKTYSVQSELAAVEQLEELRKMNRRLVDREAATEQALQFLKQNEVNLEPGESWEEYERTELMKFMETQRELRLRQEGETDDDDEEEDAGTSRWRGKRVKDRWS